MEFPVPPIGEVDLGQVFRALSDPLRRGVVAELATDQTDGERALLLVPHAGRQIHQNPPLANAA